MKRLFILLVIISTIGVLVGCNKEKAIENPADREAPDYFNETGFPIVDDEITLNIYNRQSPSNAPWDKMLAFQEYEKKTNIKVDFENVPTEGFLEKRNLILGSNDLPDIFISSNFSRLDAVEYGSNGMLIPLEGLIDKYAPNIKKMFETYPEVKQALTAPDGHIYTLSDFVTVNALRTPKPWINKTWLDNLGLDVPTTTDDLVEVLRAFKNDDPNENGENDELPMVGIQIDAIVDNLKGAWGLEGQLGYNINIENDKVKLWMTDDRYKELLQYLSELYDEGLLDNEIFSHMPQNYNQKINSGNVGFFYQLSTDAFSQVEHNFEGIVPFEGPHGDQLHTQVSPIARAYGAFAITSANKDPEASIRWIDHFVGEEGSILLRYGVEDETFYYKEDGKPEYSDEVWNDERGLSNAISQFSPFPGTSITQWINEDNSSANNTPKVQAVTENLEQFMPEEILAPPIFEVKTAKKVNTMRSDIDAYFEESRANFISGEWSFDKWDEYVSTLEKMEIEELEEIYQEAYDDLYKN